MAVFYSNMPLVKETPAQTVLQMFVTEDGTISIIDETLERYKDATKLMRGIKFVKADNNEYQIRLGAPANDGIIIGLYIAEGSGFRMEKRKDPIFLLHKKRVEYDLKAFFDPDKRVQSVTIGLFFPGTKIFYKKDGVPYMDELTEQGWRIHQEVESISDVIASKPKLNKEELVAMAEQYAQEGAISKNLLKRYKIFLEGDKFDGDGKMVVNFISKEEMRVLQTLGLKG